MALFVCRRTFLFRHFISALKKHTHTLTHIHIHIKKKKSLKIPVLIITDCNPYGLSVYHTYSPPPHPYSWVGLRPSQAVDMLSVGTIRRGCLQSLTDNDIKLCSSIYQSASDGVRDEIDLMRGKGWKVEVEAMGGQDLQYFEKVWVRMCVERGDYI